MAKKIYHLSQIDYYDFGTGDIYIKGNLRTFDSLNSLIDFLAYYVEEIDGQYYNRYIDEINVTGRDILTVLNTKEVLDTNSGQYIEIKHKEEYLRPYYYWRSDGASIDVRKYMPEILKRYKAWKHNLIKLHPETHNKWRTKKRGKGNIHHTTTLWRKPKVANCFRREYELVYEDDKIYYKYRPDPEFIHLKSRWRDDFLSRGECGWKTHKHRHQWEHRIFRKK